MALASRAARASLRTSMRAIPARLSAQHGQTIMKRSMSSSGGHGLKSSSDMPWMVGSAVVFVPLAFYLVRSADEPAHGHGHSDTHHGKEEHEPPSDGEGMTDDEGTEASSKDVNASMQEGFNADSPKDAQSAEASEGDGDQKEKPKGQKGTFQNEGEPPQPTNIGDARDVARDPKKEASKQAKD